MQQYDLIGMIPARLGSKRIPRKNIRYLGDKPLIQYPIDLARQTKGLREVWVNTESEELGKACETMGAKFHLRPAEFASDTATNREFTYEFMQKHPCDYVVMINPTSPMLRPETVQQFIDFLQANEFDTVMSVISYQTESFYEGKPINFSRTVTKINSQHLEPVQGVAWALTAWKRSHFMALQERGESPVFSGNLGLFAVPKDESVDLDNPEDWNIAEGLLRARLHREETSPRYLELKAEQ